MALSQSSKLSGKSPDLGPVCCRVEAAFAAGSILRKDFFLDLLIGRLE
jgi:hypothetical protein